MARLFHKKRTLNALSELNVTPLIDLAFSLLIIFMITTPLLEQAIPIKLPVQKTNIEQSSKLDKQIEQIGIDKSGKIIWNNKQVDLAQLDLLLTEYALKKNNPTIHLRADASIAYQKVIDVIDLLKKHKLSKLSLDTQLNS